MAIGPLYGIGAGMLFGPSIHLMSEWVKARKSLAYGFMCMIAASRFKSLVADDGLVAQQDCLQSTQYV